MQLHLPTNQHFFLFGSKNITFVHLKKIDVLRLKNFLMLGPQDYFEIPGIFLTCGKNLTQNCDRLQNFRKISAKFRKISQNFCKITIFPVLKGKMAIFGDFLAHGLHRKIFNSALSNLSRLLL
jgi:hypothetical protein